MADDTDNTVDDDDYDHMKVVELYNPEKEDDEDDDEDDPDFEDCLPSPKRICAAEIDDANPTFDIASNETEKRRVFIELQPEMAAEVKWLSSQRPDATQLLSMLKLHNNVPQSVKL